MTRTTSLRPGSSWERFHFARSLAVGFKRLCGFSQTGSICDNLPHAIDGMQKVAGFNAARSGGSKGKVAAVLEDALESGGCGQHAGEAEHLA